MLVKCRYYVLSYNILVVYTLIDIYSNSMCIKTLEESYAFLLSCYLLYHVTPVILQKLKHGFEYFVAKVYSFTS